MDNKLDSILTVKVTLYIPLTLASGKIFAKH